MNTLLEKYTLEAHVKHYSLILFAALFLLTTGTVHGEEENGMAGPDLSGIEVLDLNTAQKLALESNPTMSAALARVDQARARIDQAKATWWPSLDVTGSGGQTRMSDNAWRSSQALANLYGQSIDRTSDDYALGVQASWLLFDGFYRSLRNEQAKYGEQSSEAARRDIQRLLVSAVAEAFFNAQLAQTNVKIAEADKEFYTKQLQDAQNRFDVGAGPWGDVLNIKVQLNSAKTNFMFSGREFEAASYGLAALMGIPEAELPSHVTLAPLDTGFDVSAQGDEPQQLIEEALELRPDVKEMVIRVKEAEVGTEMAKAPFYPRLQLTGAVNGARQGDVSMTGEDFGNTVLLNLSWNLFAGGADKARKIEAEHGYREAKYILANLRNQVASDVRRDMALLEAAREQVRLQRESVKLVEENRDLARNEYEAGEASLVRLNEAQRDLTTTFSRLAQSLVGYHQARQRLLASTGRNIADFVTASQGE